MLLRTDSLLSIVTVFPNLSTAGVLDDTLKKFPFGLSPPGATSSLKVITSVVPSAAKAASTNSGPVMSSLR